MGINFKKVPVPVETNAAGIGGLARSKTLPAFVIFNDAGRKVYVYSIALSIIEPKKEIEHIPSLLGRDVLNHLLMRYSYPSRRLTFSVFSADFVYPVSPLKERRNEN